MPILVKFNAYCGPDHLEGFRIFIIPEHWEQIKAGMRAGDTFYGHLPDQFVTYRTAEEQLSCFEEFEICMFDIECLCITLHLEGEWNQIDKYKWSYLQYGYFLPLSSAW